MRTGTMVMGAALCLWATEAAAQTPKTWLGTWKLDVARSKLGEGPAPRSLVVTIAPAKDGGYTNVAETIQADGKTTRAEFYARPDGKEYPVTGPNPSTIWVKRIDDHNGEWAHLRDGKVFSKGTTSYSKDGKTRTVAFTRFDEKGGKTDIVQVFDRQ